MSSLQTFGISTDHLNNLIEHNDGLGCAGTVCTKYSTTSAHTDCGTALSPTLLKNLPEIPTYAILLELLEFSKSKSSKACHVNKIFKHFIDVLFPACSVTRADRLMRRVKELLTPLNDISDDSERALFLRNTWKPQATLKEPQTAMSTGLSYTKRDVKRREDRAKLRINQLQSTVRRMQIREHKQHETIERLESAVEQYKLIAAEYNSQIQKLRKSVKYLEELCDVLDLELADVRQNLSQFHHDHEAEIKELNEQIIHLNKDKSLTTFASRKYTSSVRELYYSLLSLKLPPAKIKLVVYNVIRSLLPDINPDNLRLPGKSCASYMRAYEMPTLSNLQKSSELLKAESWHLNSDGTTLRQQKKMGFLINGLVLGVYDVSDGSSKTALDCLKNELRKIEGLEDEDKELKRFVSCTGDGAATQIKFNRLLEEESGKERGTLIENKCSMHLGVNLRAAHVKALRMHATEDSDINKDRQTFKDDTGSDIVEEISEDEMDDDEGCKKTRIHFGSDIDQFVHELCKLFGHLGTPEYCHGNAAFRVYLENRSTMGDDSYFRDAQSVYLKRQVGSRYYVTSCNAGRIFFLSKALREFLTEQKEIKKLNFLESTGLKKLNNVELLTKARLEGLLFDKVYADLMMLVKSKELCKSSIDMNVHYGELLAFLQKLTENPMLLLDDSVCVFVSETRLYGESHKINHRLHKQYFSVRKSLHDLQFEFTNEDMLLEMIEVVSKAMANKLEAYKKDHLPGGRYFAPDSKTNDVLSQLEPHNDKTESIFGMNDWLTVVLPNMSQTTRSALIEFSYNKTMKWLKDLGQEQKEKLISIAQARRRIIYQEKMQEKNALLQQKVELRNEAIDVAKRKAQEVDELIDQLKMELIITSIKELNTRVSSIRELSIPASLQSAEIKSLVKKQVQIRSLLYKQGVTIFFSHKGTTKSDDQLLQELSQIIKNNPIKRVGSITPPGHQSLSVLFDKPSWLRGAKVKHKFDVNGEEKWFMGHVKGYRQNEFAILYDTEELCKFTTEEIKEDYYNGDFWIM